MSLHSTQDPGTIRPLWYFRLPNLASSISTILPGPPIFGVVVISSAILSLISLKRDLTVGIESPTAVAASEIGDPLDHHPLYAGGTSFMSRKNGDVQEILKAIGFRGEESS